MEKMILAALVLMIIEQAFGLFHNMWIYKNTRLTYQRMLDNQDKLIKKLREQIDYKNSALERLMDKQMAPAFLITQDGIKALPSEWKQHFQDAWNAKAPQ